MAARAYDWQSTRDPWAALRRALTRLMVALADLHTRHPAIFWAVLVVCVVVLVAIVVHMSYVVMRALTPARRPAETIATPRPVRDAAWHLAESERLRREGRYADALAHRFAALLRVLQHAGALEVQPSKTPAEYVREAALDDARRDELGSLVRSLYTVLFGGAVCDSTALDEFGRQADHLAASVAP